MKRQVQTVFSQLAYCVLALVCVSLAGCSTTLKRYKVHHTLLEKSVSAPKRVIILQPDISVYQLSTGGVTEEVKSWSETAQQNMVQVIKNYARKNKTFEIVALPKLNTRERQRLSEHLALYNLVGRMGISYFSGPWQHKRSKFDYTIGPGLKFLADKTGADAAIVTIGIDYVSTKGRKAAAVGLLLAGIFIGHGARVPLGYSRLVVGVIDLRTGNLLWIKKEHDSTRTLRSMEHVSILFGTIMSDYPGIENYQKALGRK